jgi:hypothetical protein
MAVRKSKTALVKKYACSGSTDAPLTPSAEHGSPISANGTPSTSAPPTADDVIDMIGRMRVEERRNLFEMLARSRSLVDPTGLTVMHIDMVKGMMQAHRDRCKELADQLPNLVKLSNMLAQPRNAERDREIVRMHDVGGFTFGEIGPQLVKRNPKWVRKGKPLAYNAVQQAYHRVKSRLADTD